MPSPNIYLYRVGYHCPACLKDHLTGDVMQSRDKALDGRPLINLYRGDESRSELVAILGVVRHCANNSNKVVAPELERFFLAEAG